MVTEMQDTVPVEGKPEEPSNVSIMFQVPSVLNAAIEAQAKTKDWSKSRWLREFIAESLGVELPETVRRARAKKYATVEERQAAQKKRAETQRTIFQTLMKRYAEEEGISTDAGIEEFAKALGLLNGQPNE